MRYINELREGMKAADIYMCKNKQAAVTKNGKEYINVILQDKTGTVDAKIWEPNSMGIEEFEKFDYIDISGDVTEFNGALQLNIKRARRCREGEYNDADYLPVSPKDIEVMYKELLNLMSSVENFYCKKLLHEIFVVDEEFVAKFKKSSAAKTVHHAFVGGLVHHTLSVTKLCDYYCTQYPVLNRDLLITVSICHDIGKVKELSLFPTNDYTDEGQFIGHIVMGMEMVYEKIKGIENFPDSLSQQIRHCIAAHHGELEYGSPKKPSLIEACALNLADNTDAKMETFSEVIQNSAQENEWIGMNRFLGANIKKTII